MATIERRGDGWRVRWRNPDGSPGSQQCPSARSAREVKLAVEEAKAAGRWWRPAAPARPALLVDLVTAFLADLRRYRRPGTVERALHALAPFVDWLSAKATGAGVDLLTRSAVADYDAAAVAHGSSVATRRVSAWAIGSCWRWGWSHPDWRPGLAEPAMPRMPAQEARAVVAPSWAQLDAVVAIARARPTIWIGRAATLLRGLGWRVSQVLGLTWADVDLDRGTIRLRPELGKTSAERRGRTVPVARWLLDEIASWGRREGLLVGQAVQRSTAAESMTRCWRSSGAPAELYQQRPDHAFRRGLITELTRSRVDREAVEYYVGHAPGIRGSYVDPSSLPLEEVAAAIPAPACVRTVSTPEVATLDQARRRRSGT